MHLSEPLAAWSELAVFCLVLTLVTSPLGGYLSAVLSDSPHRVVRWFGPIERTIYRLCRIDVQTR
jgi:K+-transporting ATPase ATPase A chain